MKGDGLLVVMIVVFIYAAWVAMGGPQREFSKTGPFITPVTSPGESQQGYRITPPDNPIDARAYPRQVGGESLSQPYNYKRSYTNTSNQSTSTIDLNAH